ncbi:MAG: glutamine-synthetase adenylyltransferase, partial [Aquificaceae bacterium]|nr:glutamine-synthetase adenylyltransferase [Aquificaceae bacterium]
SRCRCVAGEEELRESFEELLRSFLFDRPLGEKERREIRDMRFALEGQAKKGKGLLDLKFSTGGLVDAEFLVQYYSLLERLRESSTLKACQRLASKYTLLREVQEIYAFLRLVETQLRLSKETAGSALGPQDLTKVANSLSMQAEELQEKVRQYTRRLRELFLEVFD